METHYQTIRTNSSSAPISELPGFNFKHIVNLTDDTGIIQHATYHIPNRKEGYCIDDNSRALLLAVLIAKSKENSGRFHLLPLYLSFIHYMQTDTGEFKNFMSYTKTCNEERGSEDSFGRTIMALGYLVSEGPSNTLKKAGAEIFSRAYLHIENLVSLRGIANAIIGVCKFIKYNYPDDLKRNLVASLANKMVDLYEDNKKQHWHWFEPVLTYDNAMLPLALLHAYETTNNKKYLTVAFESMHFLESRVFHDDILSPIGNQGWFEIGKNQPKYDQQGIDVMAMVLYYQQAYKITQDKKHLRSMYLSHYWFLGGNDAEVSLYDYDTGGCADGLHREGISFNQGAESTLAYWISHMVVAEYKR